MSPRRSPEFAAVLLIAQEAFPLDFRVWNCIDDRRQEVDFDRLLRDATFSPKERLMLEIAASLWTSSNHPTLLGMIADRLGDDWLAIILRALAAARAAANRASADAGGFPL
ncbi:MAG: hypothetical protein JWP40_3746 [Blastococcus sp.]|nr:hypothetical protein [Blastococcus sp.]